MPIWFELMALSLAAYAAGLLIGWALWGNISLSPGDDAEPDNQQSEAETPNIKTRSTT